MRVKIFLAFSLILAVAALAGPALAHKLLVSTIPQDEGTLLVQAFFPDGAPAQEAPVALTPPEGPSLTGRTDAQGRLTFTGLKPGPYQLVVGDELGHRAETKVILPGTEASQAKTPASALAPPPSAPAVTGSRAGPFPWTNILAGLGFIFGLGAFLLVLKLQAELKRHASGH